VIVFDLKCLRGGHVFEGWFGSSEDFERQKVGGLLLCPFCGDVEVEKAVMAPAVGAKSNQRDGGGVPDRLQSGVPAEGAAAGAAAERTLSMHKGMDSEKVGKLMQALAHVQAEALADSEWVGRRFAEEARAMHYGEEDQRPIHGEVDAREARDLIEEGVEVAPLLFPIVPPKAQN